MGFLFLVRLLRIYHNINILNLNIMKETNKTHTVAGQSNNVVSKSQKHDANLQKNSTLFFQVGLILCLLVTYALLEMNFEKTVPIQETAILIDDTPSEFTVEKFKVYEEQAPEEPEQQDVKRQVLTNDPVVVENDTPDIEITDIIDVAPPTTSDPFEADDIVVEKEEVVIAPVPFYKIEKAPIYPGCEKEKTNADRKKCMSEKITRLVSKKFSTDIAYDLGLTGYQRIYVEFKINKLGEVTDVKARAPHTGLEDEAKRVVNRIPKMSPGLQRGNAVDVIYALPIVFEVRN